MPEHREYINAKDEVKNAVTYCDLWANPDNTTVSGSAYLNLGSYINDHMGAANGKFIATATIDADGLSLWYGLSFFAGISVTSGNEFNNEGTGTFVHRSQQAGDLVVAWGGPGTGLGVDGGTTTYTTGATLTIVLDLTPGGGYNESSDFGDIETTSLLPDS